MLQETLVVEEKARRFMDSLVPIWYICAIDYVGTSSKLLPAWDPKNYALTPYLCEGGIFLKGSSRINKHDFCILNVYGSFTARQDFWDRLALRGILDFKNLILAGDLNFTIGVNEVWGASSHLDKMANFFKDLLLTHHLIDLAPTAPTST
jgi:hypothetical protein